MKLFGLRYFFVTLLAFAIVGFFAIVTFNISFLNPVTQAMEDFSMTDIFYQVQQSSSSKAVNNAVTIVDMTDLYKRSDIASALEEIEMCNPKTIGVDVVFEGLKDDPEGNEMLCQVASEYKNIVFSHRLLDYEDSEIGYTVDVHSFFADSIKINEGFTNMERNLYGGIKRQLNTMTRIQGEDKPSFLTQVVRDFAGDAAVNMSEERLNINFTPTEFAVVSYDSISAHSELIEDRVVLFGAMYEEGDMQYTPLGKIAGVELLAYGVQTMLNQNQVRYLPTWLLAIFSFVLVYITFFLQDRYVNWISKSKIRVAAVMLSSDYFTGVLLFFWMVLLTGLSALVFHEFYISINTGWAFAAMAFLVASVELYEGFVSLKTDKK